MSLAQHYLHASRRDHPDRVALFDGQRRLTYAQLGRRAAQLGHRLIDAGVAPGDRVMLCAERSALSVVAMVGILEAGATYVPVDAKAPVARWRAVAADCRPAAVVVDDRTEARIPDVLGGLLPGAPVIHVERLDGVVDSPLESLSEPDDAAYVLYTSGSTGQPKGVMISHRNIRAYIDWAVDCFGITADDVVLSTAPFHFDMSVFDVYCALASGAQLCVATDGLMLFPPKLMEFMEGEGVTVWKGVSSLLMYMARANVLAPDRLPTLRHVLFGGETLPTEYLMRWMEVYPDRTYTNAFGPTEATGISLFHILPTRPADASERIPIGTPCPGTEAYLLDEDGRPVGPGEVGELCLGGPCLSRGYLGDEEKTRRAFVEQWSDGEVAPRRIYRTGDLAWRRDDGVYEFAGRKDRQVKVMGYRIELAEVEHAARSHDDVRDAAVVLVRSPRTGIDELVAVYEAEPELEARVLLARLKGQLPPYMVPRRVRRVDALPRGDRGKVDQPAVRALVEA
jgi:D-alanine--poly(phosphoribitol) ligase subunit 1